MLYNLTTFHSFKLFNLLAEPHTHHAKEKKETHELIFSWLSWLAVLLMGPYALRRQRSRATWRPYSKKEVDRDIKPWFTVYFFDIGQLCYMYLQLTPVKTGYTDQCHLAMAQVYNLLRSHVF